MLRAAEGGRRMWDTGEPLRAESWTPLPNSSTQQAARMVELQAEGALPLHPWSYPCRQRLRMGLLCFCNPHPDGSRVCTTDTHQGSQEQETRFGL